MAIGENELKRARSLHLDIAGTVRADVSESWRPEGATGFGVRLLADLAQNFTRPGSHVDRRV